MICWQTVKEFFGAESKVVQPLTEGKTKAVVKPMATTRCPSPAAKPHNARKAPINARNYYRRNGRYYSNDDDSLIEDTMLLLVLSDLYGAGDIFERDEPIATEDLLNVDVSDTPVKAAEESTTPVYDVKVAREDYSSGYRDSDSSSSYDSGSSSCDSCGGDYD